MSDKFSLPSIHAGVAGVTFLNGKPIPPGTKILPCLKVLPTGFSWSLHICQCAVQKLVADVVGESRLILDRQAGLRVDSAMDICGCAYVDNFGIGGTDPNKIDDLLQQIITQLRELGFVVHEIEWASKLFRRARYKLRENYK